jgi:hypothetical protein
MKNILNNTINFKIKLLKDQFNSRTILAITLILFYSCTSEDFLEKAPLDVLTAEASYVKQADAEAAIAAAYGMPYDWSQHHYLWIRSVYSDMRADNTHGGPAIAFQNAERHLPNASDYEPGGYAWDQPYSYIAAANSVIDNVPKMDDPDFSDAEKNVILGQAYFFRAYQYMQLARIFGDIPLHLSTDDPEIYKPQSSQEEVFAQVEADMLLAETLLPTEHSTNFLTRSRGTKGAAQTMLAKLYAETRDFQKCADYAAKVINSGVYELVDTFDHLFDGEHEFNSESIWEGVHVSGGFQQGTYAQLQMLPPGDFSQYGDGDKTGSSWTVAYPRFNTLHSDLVTAFETMGDTVRANSSYITVSDRSLISTPAYGYSDSEPISHVYKLGRVGEFTSGHNIMLLRLADVILLRAEALNQLGNTGEAITLLNQVRARVELAPTTATSKADVAKAILDERRLELFMENSRYWDLKRYYNDDAAFVQYLNSLTESDGTSLEYKATLNNIFMPIPQKEIDINEFLVQRPGY